MAKAPVIKEYVIPGYDDVRAGMVKWPMSVIRLQGKDKERLISAADHILMCWRSYTDEAAFIFAETNGESHNTITPIARIRDGYFELDLVLRNNITTEEQPLGVYHQHAKIHHNKKSEMESLADAILEGKDIRSNEVLEKHADWVEEFLPKYTDITKENIMDILHEEIGQVFNQVLEDAGVYKQTEEGRAAFERFVGSL